MNHNKPINFFFPISFEKLQRIEYQFGLKGFAVVIKLHIKIIQTNGYYLKYDKDFLNIFSRELYVKSTLANDIIENAIRQGIFDKYMFDNYNILTSLELQKNFLDNVLRRKIVYLVKEYMLLDIYKYINPNKTQIVFKRG